MNGLLSKLGRGDLDQRIAISVINGEEHLEFEGSIGLTFFTKRLAWWIVGYNERDKVSPVEGLTAVAMMQRKENWYYWLPKQSGDEGTVKFVESHYGDIRKVSDTVALRNVFAQVIDFYNLKRGIGAGAVMARIKFHPGGGSAIKKLNCSLNEAAGLLYMIRDLRIGSIGDDIYTNGFFNTVSVKKVVEKPIARKPSPFAESRPGPADSEKRLADARLARAFEASAGNALYAP